MRWDLLLSFSGGAAVMKAVDYLIAWAREKREQRQDKILLDAAATAFDSDVVMDDKRIAFGKTAVVKVLSLGSLPRTIRDGYIRVESSQHQDPVASESLAGRKISSSSPITREIFVKNGIVDPPGRPAPEMKLVVNLACESGETYRQEYSYDRSDGKYQRV